MQTSPKLTASLTLSIIISTSAIAYGADPGQSFPATAEINDQKAGSVLVYNFYTSDAFGSSNHNSRFTLTNTSRTISANVHVFFVAESCSVADFHVCLSPNLTVSYLISEIDPGINGYIVAIAENGSTGWPRSHNFLVGEVFVKFPNGQQTVSADLAAEAFSALFSGDMPVFDPTLSAAVLNFTGTNEGYNLVPATLAASNIPSLADQNETTIIINRIGGNLALTANTLPRLFGLLYDDQEESFSFTLNGGFCQKRFVMTDQEPRLVPRLTSVIPAGRSGWMRLFTSTGDIGILGSMINFNPNTTSQTNVFSSGHNLHKLTLTRTTVSLTVPVFPPSCI